MVVDQICYDQVIGKTIKSVDSTAVNCLIIWFNDGTKLLLDVESIYPSIGLYGIVGSVENYNKEYEID